MARETLSTQEIVPLIHTFRGQRVILAADLARLYGVETRRLNEQVRRNSERFPTDFMFQLTRAEAIEHSRSQNAILKQGAMSVFLVRAFLQQREVLAANTAILKRLAEIDKTLLEHDAVLRDVYHKLLPLLQPPPAPPTRKIGFH